MARSTKSLGLLIVLLIIGGIFGTFLGQIFGDYLPFLKAGQVIGFDPFNINLVIMTVTLGLSLKLNIAGIIGFFLTLFIYYRL
jgi:hypothetical protein